MENPKVSVIVPNYNHAKYLPQRFDSIFNQTYQDFEVIILDDCSTDNSREIIEQYRNHQNVSQIIYNTENGGTSYKQWFKGVEHSQGELVWIAESDDWCKYEFLQILTSAFENSHTALAYSLSQSHEDTSFQKKDRILKYEIEDGNNFIKEQMLGKNAIYNASATVFRRSRYEAVKDFGYHKMKLCGDWLLWIQIMHDYSIVRFPEHLNYFRQHKSNTTNRYRSYGLDFSEGIYVLQIGKKICNYEFDRKIIYSLWRDRFIDYSKNFLPGIKSKIYLIFLRKEPYLFLFILYKKIKAAIRIFILGK